VCVCSAVGGVCSASDNTSSGVEGWWRGRSAVLTSLSQCLALDQPSGLHWIRYRPPANFSTPDEVQYSTDTDHPPTSQRRMRYSKVKYEVLIYSAFLRPKQWRSATEWNVLTGSHSFYLPPTWPSWLYSVSIHQMAPPKRGGTHLM